MQTDDNPLAKCNQVGCTRRPVYRFTWPGQDEAAICEEHSDQLRAVAEAMGLPLQILPLVLPEGRVEALE